MLAQNTKNKRRIADEIAQEVRKLLKTAEGGHGWWHIDRVRKLSLHIAAAESADPFIVELAALLHDIADAKFYDGNEEPGIEIAERLMRKAGVQQTELVEVLKVIGAISFRSEIDGKMYDTPETRSVQDADRLDAIGAIGIARAFNYGGYKGREIYNPEITPSSLSSSSDYKSRKSPTINHFYEKLLLLKDMMKTNEGKRLAEERHNFMLSYLKQFFDEVNTIK